MCIVSRDDSMFSMEYSKCLVALDYRIKSGLFSLTSWSSTAWHDLFFPPFSQPKVPARAALPFYVFCSLSGMLPRLLIILNTVVPLGLSYSFRKPSSDVSIWGPGQKTTLSEKKSSLPADSAPAYPLSNPHRICFTFCGWSVPRVWNTLFLSLDSCLKTCESQVHWGPAAERRQAERKGKNQHLLDALTYQRSIVISALLMNIL